MKPNWCVLLYCCACLHLTTILMETDGTTVPCPATSLSILICKSSARTKQSVISVALKTPLQIRLGICIYKTSLLHRPVDYIAFPPSCLPHILQQNCSHGHKQYQSRKLRKKIDSFVCPLWRLVIWIQICASLNYRKKKRAEPSWLNPRKLAPNLELSIVGFNKVCFFVFDVAFDRV